MAGTLAARRRGVCETLVLAVLILLALLPLPPARAEVGVDVVVTIKPIHSLVAAILEGVATPTLLVQGAASPHSFALKPSQIGAIDRSAVFIRVSERLEPFTAKISRALPDSVERVTLIDAPGLRLLRQRPSGTFDRDDRVPGEVHDHAHADDGSIDSHIWLDPENAKLIGSYIAGVLGARFPEHPARVHATAPRLATSIDALTAELTATTEPLRGKPFIVFHDAYQYFDARFGLYALGSITVSPDVPPSAKRLVELRRKIRELGAVCVFAEPLFQQQLVTAVIEDTQARAGTLDPEGLSLDPGPQLYFALMRNLAGSLKACLAPAS